MAVMISTGGKRSRPDEVQNCQGPFMPLRRDLFDSIPCPSTKPAGSLTIHLHRSHRVIGKGPITICCPLAPEMNRINTPGDRVVRQCSPLGNPDNDEIRSDDL